MYVNTPLALCLSFLPLCIQLQLGKYFMFPIHINMYWYINSQCISAFTPHKFLIFVGLLVITTKVIFNPPRENRIFVTLLNWTVCRGADLVFQIWYWLNFMIAPACHVIYLMVTFPTYSMIWINFILSIVRQYSLYVQLSTFVF